MSAKPEEKEKKIEEAELCVDAENELLRRRDALVALINELEAQLGEGK